MMKLSETVKEEEFILKLSRKEAFVLWRIVNSAANNGNETAKPFVELFISHNKETNNYDID